MEWRLSTTAIHHWSLRTVYNFRKNLLIQIPLLLVPQATTIKVPGIKLYAPCSDMFKWMLLGHLKYITKGITWHFLSMQHTRRASKSESGVFVVAVSSVVCFGTDTHYHFFLFISPPQLPITMMHAACLHTQPTLFLHGPDRSHRDAAANMPKQSPIQPTTCLYLIEGSFFPSWLLKSKALGLVCCFLSTSKMP